MQRSTPIFLVLALLARAAAAQSTPAAPSSAPADSQRATVSGVVLDSLAQRPLAGAVVQLAPYPTTAGEAAYAATTDSAGRFRIANVRPRRYVAAFFAALADSLGVEAPMRLVDVAGAEVSLDLAIPSAATIRGGICPAPAAGDSSGMVLGRVRDADSDVPLAGSTVAVLWNELVIDEKGLRQRRREVAAKANDDGWYAICGVPADAELSARAEHAGSASGFVSVRVPPRGLLLRYFLVSGAGTTAAAPADSGAPPASPAAPRGTAVLSGIVRAPGGRPLAGAHVTVRGTETDAVTADGGTFTLGALPAGTRSLEVRAFGYSPASVSVDLRDGRTTPVDVTLEKVRELQAVSIYGKARNRSDLDGFLRRRQHGFGRFVTAADIEKRQPFRTTDLLRTVPGARVMASGTGFGHVLRGRGGCPMRVVVDGMDIGPNDDLDDFVRPDDIAGIEVYPGDGGAPPQYRSGCGVVLVWTKGRMR